MLNRTVSILMLCVFLVHFAGFYVYFFVQKQQIRNEMRARIKQMPSEKLERITLTENEFKKARVEEHEIQVHGNLYDIARIEKKGSLINVYCLRDTKEKGLLGFLDSFLKSPLKDKKAPSQILKFTFLTFVLPLHVLSPTNTFSAIGLHTPYRFTVSIFCAALDSPPPQLSIML